MYRFSLFITTLVLVALCARQPVCAAELLSYPNPVDNVNSSTGLLINFNKEQSTSTVLVFDILKYNSWGSDFTLSLSSDDGKLSGRQPAIRSVVNLTTEQLTCNVYFLLIFGDPVEQSQQSSFQIAVELAAPVTQAAPISLVWGVAAGKGTTNTPFTITMFSSDAEVMPGDIIVNDHACIGSDCESVEVFHENTLKLKANKPKILFDDASAGGVTPNYDWQIQTNSDLSVSEKSFEISNLTNNKVPFTLEAGAPTTSLYLDKTGNVGLGTAPSSSKVHLKTGNTPGIRLERNKPGYPTQLWDLLGNESEIFIEDVTSDHTQPFRIETATPTDTLTVVKNGSVGIGTSDPEAQLHIMNKTPSTKARNLIRLENHGKSSMIINDKSLAGEWEIANTDNTIQIKRVGTDKTQFELDNTGNLTLAGVLNETSDRNAKTDINLVDPVKILQTAIPLEISTWRYKKDPVSVHHMGPMAQDFYSSYGLGASDKNISTLDTTAVALASIQALYAEIELLEAKIRELVSQ